MGAILFEETLYQSGSDGATFVDTLNKQGIIPGIKVDKGLVPMSNSNGESWCQGLDGLSERCAEYYKQGARFAKWRSVVNIAAGPSDKALFDCAYGLARYAAICQENGLAPIVEPEILLDGEHDIDTTLEIASKTWAQVFKCLADQDVMFEGILLKPSMVTPGADSGTKLAPEVIAEYTLKMLNRRVPPAVPGIMFLSGGQSEMESTLNLNAMNQTPTPGTFPSPTRAPCRTRSSRPGRASRRTRRPPRTPSWCAPRPTRPRSSASTTPPASPPMPRRHVREGLHLLSPRTHSSDPRAPHSPIEEPQIQFTLFWT